MLLISTFSSFQCFSHYGQYITENWGPLISELASVVGSINQHCTWCKVPNRDVRKFLSPVHLYFKRCGHRETENPFLWPDGRVAIQTKGNLLNDGEQSL